MSDMINLQSAAIVCGDIANEGEKILFAQRDEPEEPADSGWQFLCGAIDDEDWSKARVWALGEVLKYEPTLAPFLMLDPGTCISRKSVSDPWTLSELK